MNKPLITCIVITIALTLIFGPIALLITLLVLIPGLGKAITVFIAGFVGLIFLISQFGSDIIMIGMISVPFLLLAWYFANKILTVIAEQPTPSDTAHGLRIESVVPDGLAAGLGLRPGDILQAINGQPLITVDELIAYLSSHPDAFCQLNYHRNGRDLTLCMHAGPLGVSLLPC